MQDLVLLRTVEGLSSSLPARKVTRALAGLKARLPAGLPLTSVRVVAEGKEVVVRDDDAAWVAESGQGLLDFGEPERAPRVTPLARPAPATTARGPEPGAEAGDWYALGGELEGEDAERAREAYARAVELDPTHAAAHLDLGRLLHEAGRTREAAEQYRRALEARPHDPTAVTATFNLGVALEDLGHVPEAITAYERAVELDPDLADAHYNLSRLFEQVGRRDAAFRHLKAYRQLTLPPR